MWEETEFWIALTHKIDHDGNLGASKYFAGPGGGPVSVDDYYADIFDSVPGLKDRAAQKNLSPLEYMKRHGAYDVPYNGQERYAAEAAEDGITVQQNGSEKRVAGFKTPSGKLEFYSKTLAEWGFGGEAVPGYIRSHVHWKELADGEMTLLPTFRLPTLIHTRSGNAKWLQEISHTNPLWVNPVDAERLRLTNGALARVSTAIGYFVPRVWITEGIHPGVVACSHHVGRWRLFTQVGGQTMASSQVEFTRSGTTWMLRQKRGAEAFASADPIPGACGGKK